MIRISLGRVVSGWRVRNKQDWTLIGKKSPQVAITEIAVFTNFLIFIFIDTFDVIVIVTTTTPVCRCHRCSTQWRRI